MKYLSEEIQEALKNGHYVMEENGLLYYFLKNGVLYYTPDIKKFRGKVSKNLMCQFFDKEWKIIK